MASGSSAANTAPIGMPPAPPASATVDRASFGSMLDHAGLKLSEAQKAALFEVYPMYQTLIARATEPMPREAEPSVIFVPEVR